ncbi:MAG: GIY-YIG nuclease family protein [candidate division WOR-3 bacterium]
MPFFVYLIQSLSTGKFYIGHTNNLEDRLRRHNEGRSKYTKNKGPWKLIGFKTFQTRVEAMGFERKLKRLKREEVLKEILT